MIYKIFDKNGNQVVDNTGKGYALVKHIDGTNRKIVFDEEGYGNKVYTIDESGKEFETSLYSLNIEQIPFLLNHIVIKDCLMMEITYRHDKDPVENIMFDEDDFGNNLKMVNPSGEDIE